MLLWCAPLTERPAPIPWRRSLRARQTPFGVWRALSFGLLGAWDNGNAMLAPPPSPLTSVGLSAAQASEATASVWWSRLCRVCNRSMSQSWYHEHSASMTEYDTNRHRAQLSAHRCTQLAKGVRPLSGHVPMPPTAQSPAAKALVGAQYPRLASPVKLERASIVIPHALRERRGKFACYMWEGYTTAHMTRVRQMNMNTRPAPLEAGRVRKK